MRIPGVLAATLILSAATPAFAHGGQYRTPALPPPSSGDSGRPRHTPTDAGWEGWWWLHQDPVVERARAKNAKGEDAAEGGGLGSTPGAKDDAPPPEAPPEPRAFLEREVLPVVLRALTDGEAEVRSAAAVALGKMGFPRSFLPLVAALKDEHPDVRDGAILALGMVGDPFALELLRKILYDPGFPDRTRGFAALAVGLAGGEDAADVLLSFLAPAADAERVGGIRRSDDLETCAVIALGRTGSAAAAPVLRKEYAGTHRSGAYRCAAAVALGRLGDREAMPLLLQGLDHAESLMRQSAAAALGMLGRPEDRTIVAALVRKSREDIDPGTRGVALQALGSIGGPAAVEVLRTALREGRNPDPAQAAIALGVAGDLGAGPFLHRAFRDGGAAGTRAPLALAMGLMGYLPARDDLREVALGKEESLLRGHCLTALSLLGGASAAEDLRAVLLKDHDPWLRCTAARGLHLLGDRSAVKPLQDLVAGSGTTHDRAQSCYFLGILGGVDAARTLLSVVTNRDEEMIVRMHAVAGLGVLGDRSDVPLLSSLGADGGTLLPNAPLQEVQTFL